MKAPPQPGGPQTRVSTVVGDRLCIKCGYNLTGQPVLHEPHYDMLIVRCPECATIASLQEYPLLGRWARRWAALLAALWFAVILGLALATSAVLMSAADDIAGSASRPFAQVLAHRQYNDFKVQEKEGTLPPAAQWIIQNPPSYWTSLEPTWVDRQDFDAIVAEAGGWWGVVDFSALSRWAWFTLFIFPVGCMWAVALLQLRRRWLSVAGLALVALAGVFVAVGELSQPMVWGPWGGWLPAQQFAKQQIGLPFAVMTLAFSIFPLLLGLMLGRPIVRGLMRALLPPRLRSSLALLWIADGLDPPSPGGML